MITKTVMINDRKLKMIELIHIEGRLANAGIDIEPIIDQLNKSLDGIGGIGKYLVLTEIASRLMPEIFHEKRG